LAFTMGIKQVIVCINKMDDSSVNYNQARYEEVKAEVSIFLKKIGFKVENTAFIPISGWIGDNFIERSDNMKWYTGPILTEALDNLVEPARPKDKPLRVAID
jgi:elongation factor 1-alpha